MISVPYGIGASLDTEGDAESHGQHHDRDAGSFEGHSPAHSVVAVKGGQRCQDMSISVDVLLPLTKERCVTGGVVR